jgi:hypothetical protein
MSAAALSFEGAARRAPHARRVLLTDELTHVPDNYKVDDVIRKPVRVDRLMYERMLLQEQFLAARPSDRATVFMDVDIVTNRDPAEIFIEDFDIGLTWRPELPDSPINGGLIFVGAGPRGLTFFQEMIRCYDALASDAALAPLCPDDLRAWWGDQFALAAMVGYRNLGRHKPDQMTVGGVHVRLLPCQEYNFTPESGDRYSADFLDSRYFLHFKGNRKPLLAEYLNYVRQNGSAGHSA